LSIESIGMDLGIRLVFRVDHRSRTDESAAGYGRVNERLTDHVFIVDGVLHIEFPDPEEWRNLIAWRWFVLRHQGRAKREHHNHYAQRYLGHCLLLDLGCVRR